MADASKAHKLKLANSRKRFKELQELKKKKDANTAPELSESFVQDETPAESLTTSTHSSIHTETVPEPISNPYTQLPNYFNDPSNADNSVFFDNLEKDVDTPHQMEFKHIKSEVPLQNLEPEVQPSELESKSAFNDNYTLFNHYNQHSYVKETQQIIRPNGDTTNTLESNEQFENSKNNEFSESKQNLHDYFQDQSQQVSDAENEAIKKEIRENSSLAMEGVLNSNAYNLFNLSDQMSKIMPKSYNNENSITDLEKRNIELTKLLEQEKNLSEQYKFEMNELISKVTNLETEHQLKSSEVIENDKLKEELQCHSQTIRLLVAEKTELSNNLVQLELNFKNKNSECSELNARLKASRSRAFEFEQELNTLKSEKINKEINGHDQNKVINNLQNNFSDLQAEKNELAQDLLEVQEKLKNASEELINVQKLNSELFNKLSLADVKIQQLTNADSLNSDKLVETLTQEKNELEKEVTGLNNMLTSITKERNESTTYYQHYTEELNNQLLTLQDQYQRLQQENEHLSMQEQNRIRHISDLERQLQVIQEERITFPPSNSTDSNLKNELEATRELCVQLQLLVGHIMKPNYRNQTNQPYSGAPGAYRRPGNSPRGKFSRKRSGQRPPWAQDKPRSGGGGGGRFYRSQKRSGSSTTSRQLPGIQLMVALNEYPKLVMTEDQLTLLEDQILEAIDRIEDGNFRPQFLDCKRETGSLLVRCNNDSTVTWLKDTVPTLNLWEGVELKIIDSVPTTKDVSKVIVPVNYPLNFFTTEQLDKLQTDILKEIDKIPSGSFMPQFLSCIKDRGALKFNCNNLPSSEWLKTTIPTLEDWQDVEIMILDPDSIPIRSTLQLWIPGPVEEPDQVLERLERQNKGLNTQDWQILNRSVEEGGQKLFVTVEDAVLDALRKIDFNPFLNFTRVKIKRLGRYKPRQKRSDDKNEEPDTAYIETKEESEDPMSGDIGEFTAIDEVTGDADAEEAIKKE